MPTYFDAYYFDDHFDINSPAINMRLRQPNKFRQQRGFTLIELITCLIILAIVSAVAMVKVSNLQSDARISKMRGIAGNLRTGIDMIYARSVIEAVESECIIDEGIKTEVEGFFVCHGYPIAYIDSVVRLMNIDNKKTLYVRNKNVDGHRVASISFSGTPYTYEPQGDFCQVLYQPEKQPQVVTLLDAC